MVLDFYVIVLNSNISLDEQTETDSSTSSEMNFDQTYNTEDENYEGEETQYEVQHVVTPEETVSAKPSNGALETYKQPKYTIFPQRNDPESIRLQINLYKVICNTFFFLFINGNEILFGNRYRNTRFP